MKFLNFSILILTTALFTGCGGSSGSGADGSINTPDKPVRALKSFEGDWKLVSKVCDGKEVKNGQFEELGIGNKGTAFAFTKWTEDDDRHACKDLKGYLFRVTSVSQETGLSNSIPIRRQNGFLIPHAQRTGCWNKKNGKIDGEPTSDRRSTPDTRELSTQIWQLSDNEIVLVLDRSGFCNDEKTVLHYERSAAE